MKKIPSLVYDDIRSIFSRKKLQLWIVASLVGWLLFILNIFLGLSLYSQEFSSGIKEKLGMYFYIVDTEDTNDAVYARVMELSKSLQSKGMETVFASKEEAFGFLQNRIPNVVENFKRFGINNPLPATLYVMFDSDQEYQALKKDIVNYKDVISNVTDLDQWMQLKQQENRVVNLINFSRFVVFVSYILVWLLFAVILSLCGYMMHTIFADFHGKIDIKKLLGASLDQTIYPFLFTTWWVMWWAYVLCFGLLIVTGIGVSIYLDALFHTTVWSIISSYGLVFRAIMLIQIVVMIGWPIGFSYFYVKHLIKKS